MIRYTTVAAQCEAELTIEKSKFIAHIKPVRSREEADAFLKQIKADYKDATHNVPVFILGEKQEVMWASDDGEPSGTSGAPVMQMLAKEGLTNVAVVITRYFGGIKLGTGGLSRAYTSAARLALEKCGLRQARDMRFVTVETDYNSLARIDNMAANAGFSIIKKEYLENVKLVLAYEPENEYSITRALNDATNGKLLTVSTEDKIV